MKKLKCKQCGNEYYFTKYKEKIVCDVCIQRNKLIEVVEQ